MLISAKIITVVGGVHNTAKAGAIADAPALREVYRSLDGGSLDASRSVDTVHGIVRSNLAFAS